MAKENGVAQRMVTFKQITTGNFGIGGYNDRDAGKRVDFTVKENQNGEIKNEKFLVKLEDGSPAGTQNFINRSLRVDARHKALVEAIERHPKCKGSPNAKGKPAFFKDDPYAKSTEDLERFEAEGQAIQIASNILSAHIPLVAAYFGERSKDPKAMKTMVHRQARLQSRAFVEMFEQPATKGIQKWHFKTEYMLQGLVKHCLTSGVLKQKDMLITFENIPLGASAQQAAGQLRGDKAEILPLIFEALGKYGKELSAKVE